MKKKSFFDRFGCLIIIIIFIGICYLFSWVVNIYDDYETKKEKSASVEIAKGDSCFKMKNSATALIYFKSAYNTYKSDSLVARIIYCEQAIGSYSESLKWLNILADRTGNSDFISIRRSFIVLQFGDTIKSKKILDEIINNPVALRSTWFGRSLLDSWLNKDADYTKASNYYRYYVEYLGKLIALKERLILSRDKAELYRIGEKLFSLAKDESDDYEIMNGYLDLYRNNPYVFSHIFNQSYGRLSDLEYQTWYTVGVNNYNCKTIICLVCDLKWKIFNTLLFIKHKNEGYEAAINYANYITNNNTQNCDTYNSYSKYIYGIYLGIKQKGKFPTSLTKEDLDSLIKNSFDLSTAYLTIGKVGKDIYGKRLDSGTMGDKIVDPIIIMDCNDWNWRNDSIPFNDYVLNVGTKKTIKYINDKFKYSITSTPKEDILNINYVATNRLTLNILQAECNKQMVKRNDKYSD